MEWTPCAAPNQPPTPRGPPSKVSASCPDPVGPNVPTNAETVAKVTAGVQIGAGLLLADGQAAPPRPRRRWPSASCREALAATPSGTRPTRRARRPSARRFFADVGLIGGLIIASVDTEGRPSLGWRGRRAARKARRAGHGRLPSGSNTPNALIDAELVDKWGENLQSGLHVGAERGRELAHVARERGVRARRRRLERGTELADVARDRAPKLAKKARKRGLRARRADPGSQHRAGRRGAEARRQAGRRRPRPGAELVDAARDRGAELAALAQDRSSEFASLSRKQAKQTRKDLKRAQKELEKRVR